MITDIGPAVLAALTEAAGPVRVTLDPRDAGERPVLGAFLLDVRANAGHGQGGWDDVRDDTGRVVARRPPVRRFTLTYLVSALADDAATEHHLLDAALRAFAYRETLPVPATRELPALVEIADQAPAAGVWEGLGLTPRAGLLLSVTAPLMPDLVVDLAPPADSLHLGVGADGPDRQVAMGAGLRWRRVRVRESGDFGSTS